MTDEQRKMVEGALALEAGLEGRTVGAADLLMPARLAGPLARLVLEVEEQNADLRAAHAALMAPVKDADLSDAQRRSEDLRGLVGGTISDQASRHQRDLFEVAWAVTTDVSTLVREVARLRADRQDLIAEQQAALDGLRVERDAARATLEETRLDLKVEAGAESGAPHPDWWCSNGRLRLYHRYYGGDLHAVVNADGDWMLYRAGANMLEVKEEIASGPPQLKRSAMLAADAAATQVQEKP